jgi:hypothetical protein
LRRCFHCEPHTCEVANDVTGYDLIGTTFTKHKTDLPLTPNVIVDARASSHVASNNLLCRLKYGATHRLRKVGVDKYLFRVKVVLAGFIDYTHMTVFFAFYVGNGHINLAAFQGNLVSGIVQTNNETA